MTDTTPQTAHPVYMARVAAGDLAGATRACMELVEAGYPLAEVISQVLAPTQAHIGSQWERGELSVAGEHAATSITDAALAALASTLPQSAIGAPLLVVCAEGEWHSLPARMGAVLLQTRGWPVHFVGASTPAPDLASSVTLIRPLAAVVSVTVASFLPGAARTTAALHSCGVPVLAGGAGLGADGRRAQALGADAWAPDVTGADRRLRQWRSEGSPALRPADHTPPGAAACEQLRQRRDAVIDGAVAELDRRRGERGPAPRRAGSPDPSGDGEHPRAPTRADLATVLDFLAAAVLVDEVSVLTDVLAWLARVLDCRGAPRAALPPALTALAAALDDVPAARDLLRRAAAQAVG